MKSKEKHPDGNVVWIVWAVAIGFAAAGYLLQVNSCLPDGIPDTQPTPPVMADPQLAEWEDGLILIFQNEDPPPVRVGTVVEGQ